MVILKEPFLGWQSSYKDSLKSSQTGSHVPLLCFPLNNRGTLLPVNDGPHTSVSNLLLSIPLMTTPSNLHAQTPI